MTKKNVLVLALFLVGITSLTTAAWLGFVAPLPDTISTADPTMGKIRVVPAFFRLPNYTSFYSGDVCSGQNLMNQNQRASWNCQGSFGACISCIPLTNTAVTISGLQNTAGSGSVQPAGGPSESCSNYEQWAGNCTRVNGVYSCTPAVDLQQVCQGTYLDYTFQLQGLADASDNSKPNPDRYKGIDLAQGPEIIMIR